MEPPIRKNPLGRVHRLVEQLVATPAGGETSFATRLLAISNLAETPSDEHVNVAADVAKAIRDQLKWGMDELRRLGVPGELYDGRLDALGRAFSVSALAHNYQNVRQEFSTKMTVTLGWAAWTIGDTEAEVTDEERADLSKSLAAVREELVRTEGIPEWLRDFVNRNLDAIERALREYQVSGPQPLSSAVTQVLGDLVVAGPALERASAKAPLKALLSKVGAVLAKAAAYADRYEKLHRGFERLTGFVEKMTSMLPPPGP